MNINFYFQKVNKADQGKLKKYFSDKKLNRLTRLLQYGNLELADLMVRTEYFRRHNAFSVKLELSIAKKVLISEEKSHDLFKGLDWALDRLVSQLRKIESKKRKK